MIRRMFLRGAVGAVFAPIVDSLSDATNQVVGEASAGGPIPTGPHWMDHVLMPRHRRHTARQEARDSYRRGSNCFDPEIACLRSVADHAKLRMQADKNSHATYISDWLNRKIHGY